METKLEIPTIENLEEGLQLESTEDSGNGSQSSPSLLQSRQIGVSRPALQVEDLPTPEEVFRVKHIGVEALILYVLGPGVIALGLSFGSIEWLLGPLNMANFGFKGIGWLLIISVVLQVFYNVELARFTIATGEPPIVAFGRVPPGSFVWIPLALLCFYATYILGDWILVSGASLFALLTGRPYAPGELGQVRLLGIVLMLVIFLVLLLGRKVERTLEGIQGTFLPYVMLGLIMLSLVVIPLDFWVEALTSWVVPAPTPKGIAPSSLGALIGFTGLATGLNFIFIGYYRDKGFGMGHKTGYIAGLIGGQEREVLPAGKLFPEDERNAVHWKRWFRYLLIDQWGVYFIGVLLALVLPSILVSYLSSLPGAEAPDQGSILVYAALRLGDRYGPLVSGWTLVTSFVILFSAQMVILELLARNLTDAALGSSARLRQWIGPDPRKFYYPALIAMIFVVGVFVHLTLPEKWVLGLANLPNLAAMIFPLATIYLNRQLPKPARITWWSYLALLANVLFFGFFFVNFVRTTFFGV